MEKKVSVIIPIYNVEKYLCNCLESVINQTYSNLQIILVDDGSTDSSKKICDEYAQKDTRIQVIHQRNMGLSSARNSGINAACGDYFYFIDSDDCVNVKLIEIAVKIALTKNAKMVQVQLVNVEENYEDYNKEIDENYKIFKFTRGQALLNIDKPNKEFARDIQMATMVVWSKLYHRDIFENNRFVDGIKIHEDQMVIHNFIAKAGGMAFCDAPLYYYRTNESSLIRKGWDIRKLIILDCYQNRLKCVLALPEDEMKEYGLTNFVLRRYFICILKNYIMVWQNLEGEARKINLDDILKRLKVELKKYFKLLSIKDQVIFFTFLILPKVCTHAYSLRTRYKDSKKNMIIVEPLAGMGNRFLALASAYQLAQKSGKQLAVIWNVDGALGARGKDVLKLPENIKIYETTNLGYKEKPFTRLYSELVRWWFRSTSDIYYNQNEIAEYAHKYMDIEVEKHRKLYVMSWKEFTNVETGSKQIFSFIQPNEEVMTRGKHLWSKIHSDTIGIHIRRTDHIDAIQNSPLELFVEKIQKELRENENVNFYVATDDKSIQDELEKLFGNKVFFHYNKSFSRIGKAGVQDAFIDMLALARCSSIWASFGSTFSRLAGYIGEITVEVVRKGKNKDD